MATTTTNSDMSNEQAPAVATAPVVQVKRLFLHESVVQGASAMLPLQVSRLSNPSGTRFPIRNLLRRCRFTLSRGSKKRKPRLPKGLSKTDKRCMGETKARALPPDRTSAQRRRGPSTDVGKP